MLLHEIVKLSILTYSSAVVIYFCRATQKHHPGSLDKNRIFPLTFLIDYWRKYDSHTFCPSR